MSAEKALRESELDECFIVLPLTEDERPIGFGILFIEPNWQLDPIELVFMTDLARALSGLVMRSVTNETLRVRELELEDARTDAIRRLGAASEYRDNETGMHVMRMTHFSVAIAKKLGLPDEQCELLSITAPMHDVGKIGIADVVLLKPGRLTPEEFAVMKTHTDIGARILKGEDALISAARDIALSHHAHWDGTGYPRGLKGAEIPILARVCSLADVFDALTSSRPYKEPWPVQKAIDWIRGEAGKKFDPEIVVAFDAALPDILRIRELYRDEIINPTEVVELPDIEPVGTQWVAWDDSLTIGIDVIDAHHRFLVELLNNLHDVISNKRGSREVARVLKALEKYTHVHFRAEERMMEYCGFAGLSRQNHQHRRFEKKLRMFYAELHENPLTAPHDMLSFLRDWIIQHIRHEDAKLTSLVGIG
jgi:hemerythrin-like metal-binding protein